MSYQLKTYNNTIIFCRRILFALVLFILSNGLIGQHRSYYDKYEYRKKRHEINFGIGASGCLTDLGGSDFDISYYEENRTRKYFRSLYDIDMAKTRYVLNAAYLYHWKRKINFRANLAISSISADDALTNEYYRNNRNLHFKTPIVEVSAITEFYLAKPSTGTKYNLKNSSHKRIAPRYLAHLGFYFFGGVGGFYFEPSAFSRLSYDPSIYANADFTPTDYSRKIKLRKLHTEGQGLEDDPAGFEAGKTYRPFSICFPMGFGIEKALNNDIGLKLEAGFRYTMTDYIDDVSHSYYDRNTIEAEYGNMAASMSGTWSGDVWVYGGYAPDGNFPEGYYSAPELGATNPYKVNWAYTKPGFQRGNPDNNDSYFFVVMSMYKKLDSKTKAYRTINMHQKRKIKASF